ncbi:hypothetical protein OSB04_019643 [Centaurea solstitialis]|uniref:Uncharacterized protein n=1 Tax=Centaurea solstitialis TaxID=347529 RepID=A0AA38WCK7_9ASTR|nr:hypothetical protein OSB04_019643 [Centaurea solstitialis]
MFPKEKRPDLPPSMKVKDDRHIFLTIDSSRWIPEVDKAKCVLKMDRLKKKSIEIGSIIDRTLIEEVGFVDQLSTLLHRELKDVNGDNRFVSNAWEKALETREPVYYELVVEVLSTFHFNEHIYRSEDPIKSKCIRFRAARVWVMTSLVKFGVMLGLYTKPQTLSEHFSEYFLRGAVKPVDNFRCATFWATIGRGPYAMSNTKSSSIILPEHRLLHRMLAGTLTLRRTIKKKVSEGDMWLLLLLINRDTFTNLPFILAKMFMDTSESKDPIGSSLIGGQFITIIANKHGLLTQQVKSTLTEVTPMGNLG